jgi:molecular chaperone IbpA
MTHLNLHPDVAKIWNSFDVNRLAPSTVGFDRVFEVLDHVADAVGNHTNTFPPVNVVRVEDFKYNIELAVAGYKMEEIEITAAKNSLKIEGKKSEKDERTYLVKGIAGRSFTRSFVLADTVVVRDAVLADGILSISLENVIPEEQKPHKVEITVPKASKK